MSDETSSTNSQDRVEDLFLAESSVESSEQDPMSVSSTQNKWKSWANRLTRLAGFLIIVGFIGLLVWVYRGDRPPPTEVVSGPVVEPNTVEEAPANKKDEFLAVLKARLRDQKPDLPREQDTDQTPEQGAKTIQDDSAVTAESESTDQKAKDLDDDGSIDPSASLEPPQSPASRIEKPEKGVNSSQEVDTQDSPVIQQTKESPAENSEGDLNKLVTTVERATTSGYYTIQLAAYGHEEQARARWEDLIAIYPQWLDGLVPEVLRNSGEKGLYRLRAGRYRTRALAEVLCSQLQDVGESCFVIQSVYR